MEQPPSEAASNICSARVWRPHRLSRITSPSRMNAPVAFVYHEIYDGRGFSRLEDSWRRYRMARALLEELGMFAGALRLVRPQPATDADILTVHAPSLLAKVEALDAVGEGFLDYGDTPAYRGVLDRALVAVGGTTLAACIVADSEAGYAFNAGGGLHHAHADRAAGFCPFNDVAIAIRLLQREYGLRRIAVLDLDGHHGDGTQELFYREPILYVSLHRYDGRFYPGTGSANEAGEGAGAGYTLNLPLGRGAGPAEYLQLLDTVALPKIRRYQPELIFVQVGADSHRDDPMVRLGLETLTYRDIAERLGSLADELCGGRLVAVAGGGYRPETVARCWAVFLGTLAGFFSDDDPRLDALAEAHVGRRKNTSPVPTPELRQ